MNQQTIFFDFFGTIFDGQRVISGMRQVITDVSHQHRLILVTSAPTYRVREILEKEQLAVLFTHVIGSDLGWTKAEAMKRCGVTGASFVSDTVDDIQAARSVGVRPIGVSWGVDTPTDLTQAGAVMVETPGALRSILAN